MTIRLGFVVSFILMLSTATMAVERTPTREALCTSFFLSRPNEATQRGTLQFHLNGMNSDIWAHLEKLNARELSLKDKANKTLWKYRPDKLLSELLRRKLGTYDMTSPHHHPARGIFKNISTMAWKPSDEQSIASIIGRVAQLDKDFSEEKAQQISFGFEVRGAEAIGKYIDFVYGAARAYDAELSQLMDQEYPYITKASLAGRALNTGVYGAYLAWFISASPPAELFSGTPFEVAMRLTAYAIIGDMVYPSFKQTGMYALGMAFKPMRYKYESQYGSDRYAQDVEYLTAIKEMAAGAPSNDSFIYNTVDLALPESFTRELNEAVSQKREVQVSEIMDSVHRRKRGIIKQLIDAENGEAIKDPMRTLLIDQILFFDGQEPVLVNILRLPKKVVSAPRKKKEKEKARETEVEEGLVGARG